MLCRVSRPNGWLNKMKANKTHAVVSSSSALLRTRLSRCGHGLLMLYFPPRHRCGVTTSQCAATEKERPNKYRKRDIYKTPHPRQPPNSDMRTDGCCVCGHACVCVNRLTLSSVYVLCVYDVRRQTRGVCVFMCPPYIPENKQWMKGRYCSSGPADVRHAVTGQRQRKGHSGFQHSLFLSAEPLTGIILNQIHINQGAVLQLIWQIK